MKKWFNTMYCFAARRDVQSMALLAFALMLGNGTATAADSFEPLETEISDIIQGSLGAIISTFFLIIGVIALVVRKDPGTLATAIIGIFIFGGVVGLASSLLSKGEAAWSTTP